MTRPRLKTLGVAIVLLLALPAAAYDIEVHDPMTQKAYDRLPIDFRARLGVPNDYVASGKSLKTWMAEGARDEDRIFPQMRPVNHFFDPIHSGKGLRIPISCAAEGASAADWALDPAAYHGNYYSLPQVKAVYLQAVLGPNPGTRDIYLNYYFRKSSSGARFFHAAAMARS